ncbi:CocE/NonD family hydrolase [Naasia aerilata]|uniref:X-Pro dipeptidyl-peptidase n=1 Tax=Naasia aerilata TaxID=1162966 RepID=A0ABN6XQ91_9MICO|nr:CocE/NonD family hydrolase [Naasia aerilata]BDZ46037.1 X-Pro dipeptidyl-peptidase [Naasia aerilata]
MVPETAGVVAERREVQCVLRDGTRLRTTLLLPPGSGPWPALLTRHPYDVGSDEQDGRVDLDRFVAAGYLVALQDVRGRYGSEGTFDPSAQEVEDGADAVAWLAGLAECTGSVGMWGASYASETQFSALLGGSPALRSIVPAVTPVASGLRGFRFRGGVPEVGSMLAWSHYAIAPDRIAQIAAPDERAAEQARWGEVDRRFRSGELFRAGALHDDLDADETVAWMRDRLREPLDSPAHSVGKVTDIAAVDIPVFLVGGWFDVFLGSTLEMYRGLRESRAGTPEPHLLVGPWSHNNMTGRIGDLSFPGADTAADLGGHGDLTEQHLRWFDATLRGAATLDGVAPVRVYLMGADRWLALPEFPPAAATEVALHLTADGALRSAPGEDGAVPFVSDPANPVPTRGGATLLFPPFDPGPIDQAELETRADVVSWRTPPLTDELAVVGEVRAALWLATTGTDADIVVRLCDEHPDGRSILVADGIQRASARGVDEGTGAGTVAAVEPGRTEEYTVALWATAHAFQPGHRIRVDVTSSSSPRWEVGPNAFRGAGDPVVPAPAEHTIRVGDAFPSRLVLSVLPAQP